MKQLTKRKTIILSEMQLDTLNILHNYGVNINQFIHLAIKEKLQKDWKEINEIKEKIKYTSEC
jgi:hypothetical protein